MQFCADFSQKPKSVKAIYIYEAENSYYSLSEKNMVYRGLSHHSFKTMLTQQEFNKVLRFQTDNFKTLSHSIVNNNIFNNVTRPFRCIYVNCFNILRFFCWGQNKIEKMHFFQQFKDQNSGKENENYNNDPIFPSTFSALPACNIQF